MAVMALKTLHIGAICLWAFGLLVLPFLMRQRNAVGEGDPLHRLHRAVRFTYVAVVSPAALIAIASGLAIVPLRETYELWFFAKLLAVAGLVLLHISVGQAIIRVFGPEERYPLWRLAGGLGAISLAVATILLLVLAKPALSPDLAAMFTEPGGLGARFPGLPLPSHPPPAP